MKPAIERVLSFLRLVTAGHFHIRAIAPTNQKSSAGGFDRALFLWGAGGLFYLQEKLWLPEPDIDAITWGMLNAFAVISRSRRYVGMTEQPLQLSIRDINDHFSIYTLLIERKEFDTAIFALDEEWLMINSN